MAAWRGRIYTRDGYRYSVMVVGSASVAASEGVSAYFFGMFVADFHGFGNYYYLAAAGAFLFANGASAASASASFSRIHADFYWRARAFYVRSVANASFCTVPVFFAGPFRDRYLPLARAFAEIGAWCIDSNFCGYEGAYFVVSNVSANSCSVAFLVVRWFVEVFFVEVVVFARCGYFRVAFVVGSEWLVRLVVPGRVIYF